MKSIIVYLFYRFDILKDYRGKWVVAYKPPFARTWRLLGTVGHFVSRRSALIKMEEIRRYGGWLLWN